MTSIISNPEPTFERYLEATRCGLCSTGVSFAEWKASEERFVAALKREDARGTLATDEDKDWFAANRHRRHRLRAPLTGEKFVWEGDVTRASAVVIKQVKRGWRLRLSLTLARPLSEYPDDEQTAREIWEEFAERQPFAQRVEKTLFE